MWDDPPVRHRADQPGEDYPDDRRYHDWSDIEGRPAPPAPPQPVQDAPRPALHVVPDPEPTSVEPEEAVPPDPATGLRAWAAETLAKIEAEIRYRRLVDKEK